MERYNGITLIFWSFSPSLVHGQFHKITLFARRISSFAMHEEVSRVWRSRLFDAAFTNACWCVFFWVLPSTIWVWVRSTFSCLKVGAANVGSCERNDFVFWRTCWHCWHCWLIASYIFSPRSMKMMMIYLLSSQMMAHVHVYDAWVWGYLW